MKRSHRRVNVLRPMRRRRALPAHALLSAVGVSLAACSEIEYSVESPLDYLDPPAIQTGVFKSSNVSGLGFVSGDQRGVTDAGGRFTCATGQPVRFSLGNLELGETACATLAHPAALTSSGLLTDPKALNIVRLLLFLDDDQMPANGIRISAALQSLADGWAPVDFSALDFEDQVVQIIADTASVEQRAEYVLPTTAEAYEQLDSSLACAYSGVFVNYVAAGAFDAITNIALSVYRQADGDDVFFVQIQRNHPQSQLYLADNGMVELRALPLLAEDAPSGSGRVSGEFVTPDRVAGQWANAVSIQPIDATGSFTLVRIGDAFGEHRFTGTYRRAEGLDGPTPPVGHVVFALDGDTIRGDAFEISSGLLVKIAGRRLPRSNRVELDIATFGATSEAELILDETGAPVGLEGAWPGLEGSTLTAVGCML